MQSIARITLNFMTKDSPGPEVSAYITNAVDEVEWEAFQPRDARSDAGIIDFDGALRFMEAIHTYPT